MKPRVFIGSSTEALKVAEALQSLLETKDIESTLWNQGVFALNTSGLESLMDAFDQFDYACFVLRKDDVSLVRGSKRYIVRDNVIFEIGLFLGALRKERVFVIFERGNKPNLPSDLDGITFLDYTSREDGRLAAALMRPCTAIVGAIEKRGQSVHRKSTSEGLFKVSPVDEGNSRWQNIAHRMEQCKKGDRVRFISITGKNFLLPTFQERETKVSRLGPRALSRGIKLFGILLDPEGTEADFRSKVESPQTAFDHRLLIHDARDVMNFPVNIEKYGFHQKIIKNVKLRYSPVGLSFGLWLFSDVAFVEPFHLGKKGDVPHLCGFAQLAVKKGTEEYDLVEKHFETLWNSAKNVTWCNP